MIEILYQDNDILVCVKPAGTLSEESEDSHSLPRLICEEYDIPSLFAVHRLDREVSGVMVYAKTRESARSLSTLVAERKFYKEYLAVIEGRPEKDADTLVDLLFRDSRKNKTYAVDRKRAGVKEASLEYSLIDSREDSSVVKIILHTGRTHQIRVQFASRGHSVVGDRKYGSRTKSAGIALCSHKIEFIHPATGERVSFSYLPTNDPLWNEYSDILKKHGADG